MKLPSKKSTPAARPKPRRASIMKPAPSHAPQEGYILRLYINNSTSKSVLAIKNINLICEQHLGGRYKLEVIDIHNHAHLARNEQIVAVPTLIKQLPPPLRKLVGDMSDIGKVLFGLDLTVRA
jgi:circadian clock protein KaiB